MMLKPDMQFADLVGRIETVYNREKQIRGSEGSLEPLGLFLHTSTPCIWSIRNAFPPP
jgi:hypothetical protein